MSWHPFQKVFMSGFDFVIHFGSADGWSFWQPLNDTVFFWFDRDRSIDLAPEMTLFMDFVSSKPSS